MVRVSVCLDPEVAEWARAEAEARQISTSRFIARLLRERRETLRIIERLLASNPARLRRPGEAPRRGEPHTRARRWRYED